jgi:hypothetical protein
VAHPDWLITVHPDHCLWPLDLSGNERFRSDLGESSPRVAGCRRRWRGRWRCAQTVAGDGFPVLSSDGEMVDKGHRDEAMSKLWSMRSISSWRDAEEWLEGLRSSSASGGDGPAQIRTQSSVKTCRWVAPEQGEERGTKNRRQGHLDASESRADGDSQIELRRAIPRQSGGVEEEN